MGFRFTDILETIAPIGVAMIPGVGIPAAIALSAAMKGGTTALKGGGMGEILRDAAIGGATGAAGVGIGQALSKGATGAATKAAEKAASKAAIGKSLEGGMRFGQMGIPMISPEGMAAGSKVLTGGTGTSRILSKVGDVTSGALGKDPGKTQHLLSTAGKAGKVAQAVDSAFQPQPQSFMGHHQQMAAQQPGMNPYYQFGIRQGPGSSVGSLGFGSFY